MDTSVKTWLHAKGLAPGSTHSVLQKMRFTSLFRYFGPAFVVSVAYVDPGNFGTNITAGSFFGYRLLWVVLWSNTCAIFLQTLSAKLGIVTRKNLAEQCRELFPDTVNWLLWGIGSIAAISTNLAEILGGALGFHLIFGIPLFLGGLLTCIISWLILKMNDKSQKYVELAVGGFVAIISACYVVELFLCKPDLRSIAVHTLRPSLDRESLLVASGILGATVMPHVVFLHSKLVQDVAPTDNGSIHNHLRVEKMDIMVAMNVAFLINASMIVVSAATFHSRGLKIATITVAHETLRPLLGELSSFFFALALLASGVSSTVVGMYAGETMIRGFVNVAPAPWTARMVVVLPPLLVLAFGLEPVKVLLMTQVVLSFALPGAVIPLLVITARRDVMGSYVNSRYVTLTGSILAVLIIALNGALAWLSLKG